MRNLIIITLVQLMLATGCNSSSKNAPEGSASAKQATVASSTATKSRLEVLINDKPVVMKTLLAYSHGGRALLIVASSAQPKCKDYAGMGRRLAKGEVYFNLTISPMLQKDGKEKWGITYGHFGGMSRQSSFGTVSVSASDPSKEVRVKLKFDFKAPEVKMKGFEKPQQLLKVDSELVAKGCGRMQKYAKAKPRPQKQLSLKVAGKAFAVQGATLKKSGEKHTLRLTTQPVSCTTGSIGSDVVVELKLEGKPLKVNHAYLAGDLFGSQYNSAPGDKPMKVKASGPLDGDGEVTIALDGKVDNVVGYSVELAGKVVAQRCPKN